MKTILWLRAGVLSAAFFMATRSEVWAEETAAFIAQGDAAYAQREDLSQAKAALDFYVRAQAADPRRTEAEWKASRAAWWLGQHADARAERLKYFQQAIDAAQKAVNTGPNSVEAHFWLGACDGSYGENKGVLKSLALVKPIRREMAEVMRLNDRYLGGGAYRVLGVVDYKVPGMAGGSKRRARQELEKALSMDPADPFTHYYLAEFSRITGDKKRAQAELDALQTLPVSPDSLPELHLVQSWAKKLPHS